MTNKTYLSRKDINSLVRRIGQGDDVAFDILYERLYKLIFHFLLQLSNDIETIKDAIQTTFEIVIRKSRTKMLYTNCFGWILSIARKTMYNVNRKNKKIQFSDKIDQVFVCDTNNYFQKNILLKFAYDKLNREQQFLLYLIFYEEMTYNEISKIMKISTTTIKRRKKEIIDLLKEDLTDEEI